jgi:CubicO group peptidase (beta-lactamase class C family)
MSDITRRTCLKQTALALAANTLPAMARLSRAMAADAVPSALTAEENAALSRIATEFLDQFHAPGLSVAIARRGEFVYRQGFGFADPSKREPLTPSHLFRIASVTKPVTSVGVFSLIEQGKLGLNDRVFGTGGLLQSDYGTSHPDNVNDITIYHLLTHTCGGWEKGQGDPMFETPSLNHKELIARTLNSVPLKYPPGSHYGYSNFGYCILGRILEKVSGLQYPEFVRQNILARCGITGMRIGGNTLAQRAEGEVEYDGQNRENPYGMNIARMDSHGGWIAAPGDLVQFALRVDGFESPPDILRPDTIKAMTTPSAADPGYACGWAINKAGNWWHNGSLPGVTTTLVRTSRGLCWAAFTNTRTNGIDLALDTLVWKMVKAVPSWSA